MSKYEVTQAQFEQVMGWNPSSFKDDYNLPVENVNWHEAMEYCARTTEIMRGVGLLPDGMVLRLPTEAEWEYACRAGTSTPFSFGDDASGTLLGNHAWYDANSGRRPHVVGQKQPNPWGIHDLHGNLQEWCLDYFAALPGGSATDYRGPPTGSTRVRKGGSWNGSPIQCRSAVRLMSDPSNEIWTLGFRVVLAHPVP